MMNKSIRILGFMFLLIFATPILGDIGTAEERNMGGWGLDDPYNKHYQAAKFEKFKAKVVRVKEVVPMPGMTPGVAMDVNVDGKILEVQICPTWFVKTDEIGIKKGDRVNIRGVRDMINGKEVFIASKIKKEDYFELKVRFTKDGIPFWTMTPDEVFEEKKRKSENGE